MNSVKIGSIIYIGSTEITVTIKQIKKNGLQMVEKASHSIAIGKEAFETGKISADKVDRIVEIVSNFKQLSLEYGAERIALFASTAIRESDNKYYIRDRLYQETGIVLEIISDSELKNIIFMSNLKVLKDADYLKNNAIITFIGSGNLGIAFYEDMSINFLQNIMIGTIKLYEIAKNADKYSDKMNIMVKEQLYTYFNFLPTFLPKSNIKDFIVTGRTLDTLKALCNAEDKGEISFISKPGLESFYNEIVALNADSIAIKYNLNREFANELVIATIVIENLLEMTEAETIAVPNIFFFDIIFYEMMLPKQYEEIRTLFYSYAIESSRKLAQMYKSYGKHIEFVEEMASAILKKLSKNNRFKEKEVIYLKIAVILHNIGKYINPDKHYLHSSYILQKTDIIGLSEQDRKLISLIVKYQSYLLPTEKDEEYAQLSAVEKISVSKLSAVLRLADALDKNYSQKFKNINIKQQKGLLIVEVESKTNTYIEQIKFNEYCDFFKEVFGIEVKLVIKRGI